MISLQRCRIFHSNVSHRLTVLRCMGGGPRTFPGGLNKWQWKRLHEKQARQKEKRLLDQEKQIYQARVRSQIRSTIANADSPKREEQNVNSPNFKPLSPKEHIKALADRFMKDGAEDLWNEADGPISSPSRREIARIESNHDPINLRRVVSGRVSDDSSGFSYNQMKPRHYSVYLCSDSRYSLLTARHYSVRASSRVRYRKNDSSSSEDGTDEDEGFMMTKTKDRDLSRPLLSLVGSSDREASDDDDEDYRKGNGKKVMMSSAALGKYDIKKTKRIPLKFLDEEDDLSLHVQAIRSDFNKRCMAEKEGELGDDSILSSKRFDECDASPLTIKALTLAGYVQMTKVQDASISACLEGKDALVKAKTGTGKSAAFLC